MLLLLVVVLEIEVVYINCYLLMIINTWGSQSIKKKKKHLNKLVQFVDHSGPVTKNAHRSAKKWHTAGDNNANFTTKA